MEKLQLTVLTSKDLKRRYDALKNTNMACFTNEAISEGYSIGILHYESLILNYITAGEKTLAFDMWKRLLKVRCNIRSLVLLPYFMFKKLIIKNNK